MKQRTCSEDSCLEPARAGSVCDRCRKRAQRGTGNRPRPRRTPLERLREAALTYADACDMNDEDFSRADRNLAKSAERYVETLPRWAHPPTGEPDDGETSS